MTDDSPATSQRTIDQMVLFIGIAMLVSVVSLSVIAIRLNDPAMVKDVANLLIGGMIGAFTTRTIQRKKRSAATPPPYPPPPDSLAQSLLDKGA